MFLKFLGSLFPIYGLSKKHMMLYLTRVLNEVDLEMMGGGNPGAKESLKAQRPNFQVTAAWWNPVK